NFFFFFQAEDGIRDRNVTGVQTCALPICKGAQHLEQVRDFNQLKMLRAFAGNQMSATDMLGTTGYGLWDTGRAKLEAIFAQAMRSEERRVGKECRDRRRPEKDEKKSKSKE